MRLLTVILMASAVTVLFLNGAATAQSRSSTPQAAASGSKSLTGGSMFSGSSGGLSGSSGGLGSSGGGLGGGGLGGQGGGLGGAGGGSGQGGIGGGQNALNTLGQQQNAGFIGRNGSNNQFIGAAAQGLNGQNGQNANQGRQSNRGQRNQGQQQFNQNGGGQEANRNLGVRPRQKVAFTHPTFEIPKVVASLEGRFQKMSTKNPSLNTVKLVTDQDGTVVLTGEARSATEAKLAESLVRLEPGIRGVRNELTFPAPTDDAQ